MGEKTKQGLAQEQKCCQFPGIHGVNKWECDPEETNKGQTCCDGMKCAGAKLMQTAMGCPPGVECNIFSVHGESTCQPIKDEKTKQCLAQEQKCCQFPGIHGANKWECDPEETNKGQTCCDGMECAGATMLSTAMGCPPGVECNIFSVHGESTCQPIKDEKTKQCLAQEQKSANSQAFMGQINGS